MTESRIRKFGVVCLIASDVQRLGDFYQAVLQLPVQGDGDYVWFSTGETALSICAASVAEAMAPGVTDGAGTGRTYLEFEVRDVDAEYARLTSLAVPIAKPPTTQPWGVRSVWFRDPEGNLVNFNARVAG